MRYSDHRTVSVGCDLFLGLKMYQLPQEYKFMLSKNFPEVSILPVNCPSAEGSTEDIEIYWGNRISEAIIEASPRLKWIHFGSVGVNNARIQSVIDRGIIVTSSRGLVSAAMVASALSSISGLARGLHRALQLRESGLLTRANYDVFFEDIQDLEGQQILIVGLGDVGRKLAKVCASIGMRVVGVRRHSGSGLGSEAKVVGLECLAEFIPTADFIVNLLPLTSKTKGVFDSNLISLMKKSAFFINLGRGETVDENSLIAALRSQAIAGAAMDVFEIEPLEKNSELWLLDNVILTPHVAGVSSSYWPKQVELFSYNLRSYLRGETVRMRNVEDMNAAI